MNHELAKTLTTALVQFIDRERPEGTMDCSSAECEKIEKAFEGGTYDVVEKLIKKKLLDMTEFELEVSDIVEYCKEHGENVAFDYAKRHAKTLLALAKKELPMPEDTVIFQKGVEEGRRLEREESHENYVRGYANGYKDAEKRYNESVAYHYPDPIPPGVAYKSPQCYTDVMITPNTNSGTSTLKAEG